MSILDAIEQRIIEFLAKEGMFITLSLLAGASNFVVAIGLYFEYERHELRIFGLAKTRPLKPQSTRKFHRPVRKTIGSALVVAGVALEFFFGITGFCSALIREQQLQNQLMAVEPRAWRISPNDRSRLVKALEPFKDQKVDFVLWVPEGEDQSEPYALFRILRDVLMDAKWRDPTDEPFVKNRLSRLFQPQINRNGYLIGIAIKYRSGSADERTKTAARKLVDVLNDVFPRSVYPSLEVTEPPSPFWPSRDDAKTIVVEVGEKSTESGE